MSMFGSIQNLGEKIVGMLPSAKITYGEVKQPQTVQTPPETQYRVPGRNLTLSSADLEVLKPVLYGEVSNRNATKKELESRVIFNTALNRMQEYVAKGQPKTLAEVLSMPNQYQAYGGQQFKSYSTPPDDVAKAKKDQIESIMQKFLNEMEGGEFPDVTEGAYYYIHHPTGAIEYDNKRPLFQTNLGRN